MKSTRPKIAKHIDLKRQIEINEKAIEFYLSGVRNTEETTRLNWLFHLLNFAHWGYSTSETSPSALLSNIEEETELLLQSRVRDKANLSFLGALSAAALAGSLLEDDRVLRKIGEWMESKPCEQERVWFLTFQPILYRVCNLFRKTRLKDFRAIDAATTRQKIKVPAYLIEAVEAIDAEDNDAAFSFVLKALESHVKKVCVWLPKELLHGYEIPAVFPSLVWNAAIQKGFEPPTHIEDRLIPFVITRQTLGLND